MEAILFSGGIDSTVLLQYFLKNNKDVHVIYCRLGYDIQAQPRIPFQDESVKNILLHFEKIKKFKFTSCNLFMDIDRNNVSKEGYWLDDQWAAFFGGKICRRFNYDNVWMGLFSYQKELAMKYKGPLAGIQYYDGSMDSIFNLAYQKENSNFKIKYPIKNFNKNEIDSLNSKKEAFDYIDKEIRGYVRACEGSDIFCGKCIKCKQWKDLGIKNGD